MVTERQIYYVGLLHGDQEKAAHMTRKEASAYIDQLKKGGTVTTPASAPEVPREKTDAEKRQDMLSVLLKSIPEGYFATQLEDGAKVNYLRISRPKRNHFAGSIKVQTQHGPRLENAAAFWPSGKVSVYDHRVIDMLMLLVTDYQGCMMRYARLLKHCCRCNAELTDERSQHYGIGPECEKILPWVIESIDERHGGKSFERLAR
jgi:hypothetical protein